MALSCTVLSEGLRRFLRLHFIEFCVRVGVYHPVGTVSWYDCVKWCNARSEKEGLTPVYYTDDVNVTNAQVNWTANGYRLPTEAE